ncbi:MAG: hypothetical protein JNL58_17300 [Planctomyces sp.]|nr:hypothetical protein [Planctomyces sp.]
MSQQAVTALGDFLNAIALNFFIVRDFFIVHDFHCPELLLSESSHDGQSRLNVIQSEDEEWISLPYQ